MKPSVALKRYKEVTETYNRKQQITIPMRKGAKIADHIITNLQENKLITTNVLPCPTVSDHDENDAFIIFITNIPRIKFQTRTRYIRSMKHFNIKDYLDNFKTLSFYLVYSFEDKNEQPYIEQFNTRMNQTTPLVKTKFTQSPAPWMKQFDIADLRKKQNN